MNNRIELEDSCYPDKVEALKITPIEKTEWAKGFLIASSRSGWQKALTYAQNPHMVFVIYKTDVTGDDLWAVAPESDLDFWMDATPTRTEVVQLCKLMGWKYRIERPIDKETW